MSKRFQPMKEFGRTTKKPKLDISIIRRPPVPAQGIHRGPSPVKCSQNINFWDDDDDDVILLATQVAESQAAVALKTPNAANITDSEITFSEFAPHLKATTSTQRPSEMLAPDRDLLSHLFDDDDDDFALLTVGTGSKQPPQSTIPHNFNRFDENPFKLPAIPATSASSNTQTLNVRQPVTSNCDDLTGLSQAEAPLPFSQSAARRQLASERQIKFLMERVDVLKKENTKLSKDLGETKSKIESKEGETSLLRDELRHVKQQMQSLKMEKIFSTEAARTECNTKIAQLSKRVEAKETELQLKSVEYSVLKMRHEKSMRNEMSMRNDTTCLSFGHTEHPPVQKQRCKRKERQCLMRMRGLTLNEVPDTAEDLSELIYEQSHERGTSKERRTFFQLELEQMQMIVAQLHLGGHDQQHPELELKTYMEKVITSVCKVFPELWSYVHSLEFPKNSLIHPYHEYNLQQDVSERTRICLHQPTELYEEERALSVRRYVAALGVVCRKIPNISNALLRHQHGEYMLLQIAIESICKLGFSREICEHFGLVEGFAALLHSMLLSTTIDVTEQQVGLLVSLLKHIIFTRPSPWVFREISFCILEVMRLPQALSMLCVNSNQSTFATDRVKSLYRFSNDSCLLQVYAGLLEIAFPVNTKLHATHFKLLTVICGNHVRFVYNCFANPPKFIRDLLPSYDDDDDDEGGAQNKVNAKKSSSSLVSARFTNNSTTAVNGSQSSSLFTSVVSAGVSLEGCANITCDCYTKLCLSVVTLLFQLLREWIRSEKSMETSHVAEISKMSVQLLHVIFCDNYLTLLFRDAEETTKHYLCLICKWWSENSELLHFNGIQMNFLQKLQNSHVMPKQLSDEENFANITTDVSEWYRLTSDVNMDADMVDAIPSANACKNLQLMEDAGNADKFFEGLKGYAFNFQ